jgi:hypothetical protein
LGLGGRLLSEALLLCDEHDWKEINKATASKAFLFTKPINRKK